MTAAPDNSGPENEQSETPEAILSVAAATEALLREIFEAEIARWSDSDPRLGEAVVNVRWNGFRSESRVSALVIALLSVHSVSKLRK